MKPSLGVYVHIPFCASHCAYCHFVIDLARGEVQPRYVQALLAEIQHRGSMVHQRVDSIYLGGGTPSWIEAQGIVQIMEALETHFTVEPAAEITIEVNPDSIDERKMEAYCQAGINRVSVGVQSFQESELQRLGRTHTARQAKDVLPLLRRAGVKNISMDLMAALPAQTAAQWKENLAQVEEILPEHISLYLFDLDEASPLGRKILTSKKSSSRFDLPTEDEVKKIYDLAVLELDRLGYEHYEISNFARRCQGALPEQRLLRSRHNLKYWNLQPYLGLGCAAHSFMNGQRWHNENSTLGYMEDVFAGRDTRRAVEEISTTRLAEDAFIFGLRQIQGIRYSELSATLHRDTRTLFREVIDPLIQEGWLLDDRDTLRLASHAFLVSNEIFRQFLTEESL